MIGFERLIFFFLYQYTLEYRCLNYPYLSFLMAFSIFVYLNHQKKIIHPSYLHLILSHAWISFSQGIFFLQLILISLEESLSEYLDISSVFNYLCSH